MKRILVRAPNWIGDQMMAYPFFSKLRSSHPEAWIGVVCAEWVKDVQFSGLVDEVFVLPKPAQKTWTSSLRGIRELAGVLKQKGPWDLGILLPNSFGSALLFFLSKVKNIQGYRTDLRGWFLKKKIKWNPDPLIHRADSYLHLLGSAGATARAVESLKNFDPQRDWPEVRPLDPPNNPYVVIAPGATADSRRWSAEHFSTLIQLIHSRWGYRSVVVGGRAETSAAEMFARKNLPIIDLTGRGSVSSLWKIFRNAEFTVCNESGLAHVAALCGSDVLIVCGAADPKRTKPLGPGIVEVIANTGVSCWPCEKNVCRFTDGRKNRCHEGIAPDQVLNKISEALHV